MLTITITNRNRDLRIVKNCLDSLKRQSNSHFEVTLVDYGSDPTYLKTLQELVRLYGFITLIHCETQQQLWNKSRAINIALKKCETPYFMVGDIDLMFHPEFVEKALTFGDHNKVTYFKYGFLSKEESLKQQDFHNYKVAFYGGEEVTGTTLFPAKVLKSVHGYDEFYHGWGAEDTDIHIRLKNAGLSIYYHETETLVKHQWHPKAYRSKSSTHPFHSKLEKINHAYMINSEHNNVTVANLSQGWGLPTEKEFYDKLNLQEDLTLTLNNNQDQIDAALAHLKNVKNKTLLIQITPVALKVRIKEQLKERLGKKHQSFLDMEVINNMLLIEIIKNYRNQAYNYSFDREKETIQLKIVL
ncbi:glycosyltransferase family 2 protein [Pseudotamlana agarivorans]|uniref:glycosyltransferase family 2 protein n=1 Tax=Pseudotamlana agarivorans TaxID=481183 RepID=UPI00082E7266|nr:glycosyltransferase [Tamlana agarivorans]